MKPQPRSSSGASLEPSNPRLQCVGGRREGHGEGRAMRRRPRGAIRILTATCERAPEWSASRRPRTGFGSLVLRDWLRACVFDDAGGSTTGSSITQSGVRATSLSLGLASADCARQAGCGGGGGRGGVGGSVPTSPVVALRRAWHAAAHRGACLGHVQADAPGTACSCGKRRDAGAEQRRRSAGDVRQPSRPAQPWIELEGI